MNFDEIQKAMEDVRRDVFDYFLDTNTGEVIVFSEEVLREVESRLCDDEYDEEYEGIEYIEFDEETELPDWIFDEVDLMLQTLLDESGRYVRIPERDSGSAYRSMAEFIETVGDPNIKEELIDALNGKGAFKRFKDALIRYPRERKRWHGYNAKAMRKDITEWLRSLGIEPI
ncbi:MAG: UPF0158 family protein [Nitrospirota bacterium]